MGSRDAGFDASSTDQMNELPAACSGASLFRPVQQRQRQYEAYKLRDDKARRVEGTGAGERVASERAIVTSGLANDVDAVNQ